MPFITWTSNYTTGIKRIDSQHKRLIELINEIHEAIIKGTAIEQTDKIIQELLNYTINHFAAEEEIMKEFKFVSFLSHRKEHNEFKIKIINLQKQVESGRNIVSMEIIEYLRDWFIRHILVSDALLGLYLRKKEIENYESL